MLESVVKTDIGDRLYEYASQIRPVRVSRGRGNKVYSVCFSPDGRLFATGTVNKLAYLWEVAEEKLVHPLEGHGMFVWSVCFSADGRTVATGSGDMTIFFWDVATGRPFRRLEAHNSLYDTCFSPDGRYVAAGSHDRMVYLWDLRTYKTPKLLAGHTDDVYSVCFSPDSRLLASGSYDHTVILWEVATARRLAVLTGGFSRICSVSFSPDGRLLAFGSSDHTVRLWEVASGRELLVFAGHRDLVWSVSFSPDGRLLASGSGDRTVRLWEVNTGRELRVLEGHEGEVNSVSFSPDGRLLASGSDDKTVRFWDVSVMEIRPSDVFHAVFRDRIQDEGHLAAVVRRHLLSLPFTHVELASPGRAVAWLRGTASLGLAAPICLVHDLGALLVSSSGKPVVRRPSWLPADLMPVLWEAFLQRLADHPKMRQLRRMNLADNVIGVVLGKILAGLSFPHEFRVSPGAETVLFARRLGDAHQQTSPGQLWETMTPAERFGMAALLTGDLLVHIETRLAQLDVGELRFLHLYGIGLTAFADPRQLVDLFSLLELPPPARLALISMLRLLPNISEAAAARGGMQMYAMGGYQGLSRKGSLDSLVPVELAYPQRLFCHRLLNRDALYYGRESAPRRRRQLAYIITQLGLEVRGDDDATARGLTLALARTMKHRGYDVYHSFVGSRWRKPEKLDRPEDVQRVLYYRDDGWLAAGDMLAAVLRQLRTWEEQYQQLQVFWVVNEFWDRDDWQDHHGLYAGLKQRAGQQGWVIGRGDERPPVWHNPALTEHFHCCRRLAPLTLMEEVV
ncbi:MAG: WD40 repeat domain-containing protein [Deltaproteobacteria bacterium]|nr:WD40 repeat domain-containing protein [Candidatus Anaeroferrophillus wilburensis]MBN2890162.1 WD40 repeat domain-containing protein [Deltaproteobacteria bacterium]